MSGTIAANSGLSLHAQYPSVTYYVNKFVMLNDKSAKARPSMHNNGDSEYRQHFFIHQDS